MNTKKITLISTGIVVAILAAIFLYFYVQFNQPSSLSSHIPKEAEKVVYLNSKTLLKLFIKNRNDTSFKGFDTRYKDYFKNLKDPKNNGIDFLKDAVYIENNKRKYVLMLLKNEDVFSRNISSVDASLFSKVESYNNYKKVFSTSDSFVICWTKNVVCFIPKQDEIFSESILNEIFEQKKENFSTEAHYQNIQKTDALIWFYLKNTDIKINESEALKGYLNYPDSIIILATDNIDYPYNDSTFRNKNTALKNTVYINSGNDFLNKTFLEWTKILMPDQYSEIEKIDLKNSQKLLQTGGKKIIENKIITYEYDDDFNKQKIEKTHYDTLNEVFLNINKPEGQEMMFSNTDNRAYDWTRIPEEIELYVEMNESFFGKILPVNVPFQVELIHQKINKNNIYRLTVNTPNMNKFIEALSR